MDDLNFNLDLNLEILWMGITNVIIMLFFGAIFLLYQLLKTLNTT